MAPKNRSSKRKNRSSDTNSTLQDSSVVDGTGRIERKEKKPRSESRGGQRTLANFVNVTEKMSGSESNATYIAEKGGGTDGICERLTNIENGLQNKFQILENKVVASEGRLPNHISEQFERLVGDIFILQQENDSLRNKLEAQEDIVGDLKDEVVTLKKIIQREQEKINDMEQYQRRDSVRFLGVGPDAGEETVADCEGKVLHVIQNVLNLKHISAKDISIAHRIGVGTVHRPRPIIVKFMSRKIKTEVIQKRRLLKGSYKGIVEDLTPLNMKRLQDVKNNSNVKNSRTKEGVIYAQLHNNNVVRVIHGDYSALSPRSPNINMQIEDREVESRNYSQPNTSTPKHPPRHRPQTYHQAWDRRNAAGTSFSLSGAREHPGPGQNKTASAPDQSAGAGSSTARSAKCSSPSSGQRQKPQPATTDASGGVSAGATTLHGGRERPRERQPAANQTSERQLASASQDQRQLSQQNTADSSHSVRL